MTDTGIPEYPILEPDLQIAFYYRLKELRGCYLHEALMEAVGQLQISQLDEELASYVKELPLKRVAMFGIRGEVFFPVPCILLVAPRLLGYYRLLLGLSQKEVYNKGPFGRFRILEEEGRIPEAMRPRIPALCRSLARTAELLVEGIDELSPANVHDLQLLTLGPQLRGSRNTSIGSAATAEVYELIHGIVQPFIHEETPRTIQIKNASGRMVSIEFFSDPDISIKEVLESRIRPLVSVEIKGGTDASNIHNRLGEAEKSHQKAKMRGFFEFWTILRVPIDYAYAKNESPTTTHFFHLDRISNPDSPEYSEFRELLGSLMGIRI